jgi:penicillin amidase
MVSAPWRWHARLIELWDEGDRELIGGSDWDAVALESLAKALDDLSARHGSDPDRWQWGKVHRVRFAHALAEGDSTAGRVLDRLLSRRRAAGGGHETVNAIGFIAHGGDFTGVYGPTYRLLADLGDPDASRWQHMSGQSGHPGSRHYDDLIDDWIAGRTNPVALVAADTLTLQPA